MTTYPNPKPVKPKLVPQHKRLAMGIPTNTGAKGKL